MSVGILGAGGVGGLLAALFQVNRDLALQVLVKSDMAERLRRSGLRVQTPLLGEALVRDCFVEALNRPVDFLFVCCKAPDLLVALRMLNKPLIDGAWVIPLLNGVEHLDILRSELSRARVLAAVATGLETYKDGAGIKHTSAGIKIMLGGDGSALSPVVDFLKRSHIDVEVSPDEVYVMWDKFVRIHALAVVTAASGLTLGEILQSSVWCERLSNVLKEGLLVGRHYGYRGDFAIHWEFLMKIQPLFTSSLARDVAQRRAGELDAIAGAMLRFAKSEMVPTPISQDLFGMIRKRLEPSTGLPTDG